MDKYSLGQNLGYIQVWEIVKTTNNLLIDKLFVISQIQLHVFVKGQIDVFIFLSFMKLSC